RLIYKHAAGDDDRVLREKARQIFGVFSEEDLPIAAFSDVTQQVGVAVHRRAQSYDADRDARFFALSQQFLILTRLFRIGGVGEENDVARAGLGFEQHVGGRG